METEWAQTILTIASIITVSGGLFSWLRNDSKSMRDEFRGDMQQLRSDMQDDMQQLRMDMLGEMQQLRTEMQGDLRRLEGKVDTGFKALDDRLRAVENEQSRVVGLLEGLGLAGALPNRDS